MTTHETNSSIGDYLTIKANEREKITFTTENGEEMTGVILETPDDVPTREHTTKEITVELSVDKPIVGLYAKIMEIREMSIDYDLYAVQITENNETTELGEITSITVHD